LVGPDTIDEMPDESGFVTEELEPISLTAMLVAAGAIGFLTLIWLTVTVCLVVTLFRGFQLLSGDVPIAHFRVLSNRAGTSLNPKIKPPRIISLARLSGIDPPVKITVTSDDARNLGETGFLRVGATLDCVYDSSWKPLAIINYYRYLFAVICCVSICVTHFTMLSLLGKLGYKNVILRVPEKWGHAPVGDNVVNWSWRTYNPGFIPLFIGILALGIFGISTRIFLSPKFVWAYAVLAFVYIVGGAIDLWALMSRET